MSRGGFGPQKRKIFLKPYANHMSRTNSWSHDLRNRENRGDCHVSRCALGALWGYLCATQGTAENPRTPRTLWLLCRNKKTCEIIGLHRRLKQTGGGYEIKSARLFMRGETTHHSFFTTFSDDKNRNLCGFSAEKGE